MTVGERIRQARAFRGKMSRPKLAELTGIPYPTLAGLENGDQSSSTRLHAIATALNVRLEWLADGSGPMEAIAEPAHASRGSHAARPDAATIRNAQHALLTFLRRRDPDATLDLLDPADAELFAGALEIIQGGDDQITVSAQVADLVEAYEGRRGERTEGEQDGGAARGKTRKSGAR